MDPGRYALQQGWNTNSALEGYGAAHGSDYRAVGSSGRRVPDERFSRDSTYSRNAYPEQMLDRDFYPPLQVSSTWSQSRRRNFDDENLNNDSRRPTTPFHDMDSFHDPKKYHKIDRFHDRYRHGDGYHDMDGYGDYAFERHSRSGTRDHDEVGDHYDLRHKAPFGSRENSRESEYDTGRYNYESDQDKGRRESSWRRHDSHEPERGKRGLSWDKSESPYSRHHESRSRGHDDRSRSRSPKGRSSGRSYRDDIYDDKRYDRDMKRRDYDCDEKHFNDSSVSPSATVVVKGLSQKTTEEDLYQILAEWGPLRHVRVIKERASGVSRGFAFVDFPSVEAACSMMDGIGENGLTIDGRKLFFEYSSKPTGGTGAPTLWQEGIVKSCYGYGRPTPPSDWICTICGCVNFARRTSCFQCNEPRTDDAVPADMAPASLLGRKGSDTGPTHVLVVRGLDDNADEEMLRYEFAKHAPLKDLRLVRDKFTHVSRGFAFLHFHSVEDATKALEATNGTTLEKNGQMLRVAYAKSIHGPLSGGPQSSSLAAAAIEAATFAQQYDAVGWAPKEYNPDDKQSTAVSEQKGCTESQMCGSAPQAGFVWDEKSGYYYDASSGFYYDGNTGLYYDGNSGIWYTYDNQNQQYVPCVNQGDTKVSGESATEVAKASSSNNSKKVVISAPATTIKSNEGTSLPDAVQAAASAALAAEKKEKEKQKEIKLASKNNLLASKKKMTNVLAIWKQRNNEGQAARVVLEDNEQPSSTDDKHSSSYNGKNKVKVNATALKEASNSSSFSLEQQVKPKPVNSSSSGTIKGVIRGSGRGVIRADTTFSGTSGLGASNRSPTSPPRVDRAHLEHTEALPTITPFKTDASALCSYTPTPLVAAGCGKRRFSETPMQSCQPQTAYRDRAAERRSRYGSHLTADIPDDLGDLNFDHPSRKGSLSDMEAMPFPPGVGGGHPSGDLQSYEIITADRIIDENNVGNRMLRSMGWQEGLGLGKDGSGIKEPVQTRAVDDRAGLGSQQRKSLDQSLEAKPGDSYKTIIHKKAIARFREMSS